MHGTYNKKCVLYGFETWSLALIGEFRFRVLETAYFGRYLGLRRGEYECDEENCIKRSFIICTVHKILL
jgi:hypothetical protein